MTLRLSVQSPHRSSTMVVSLVPQTAVSILAPLPLQSSSGGQGRNRGARVPRCAVQCLESSYPTSYLCLGQRLLQLGVFAACCLCEMPHPHDLSRVCR